MQKTLRPIRVLFYGLVFLFFFELVSDFIESIYAFGLLGTNIPPEIFSVLLFFTPLALLPFKQGLGRRSTLTLAAVAGLSRALEVSLTGGPKLLAAGIGVGCLLVFFPAWLSQRGEDNSFPAELTAGLGLAWSGSMLLRVFGAGTDVSLLIPGISGLLAAALVVLVALLARESYLHLPPPVHAGAGTGRSLALSTGVMAGLVCLLFAFTSPGVVARWSGLPAAAISAVLSAGLLVGFIGLITGFLDKLSPNHILLWNLAFLLCSGVGILLNQVRFPAQSAAFPIDQPEVSLLGQLPLLAMLLLSPVILEDALLLFRALRCAGRQPSPRQLAGGYALGSLLMVVILLAQVFTTVYDYIPVVGPLFRDRFWLVFTLTALGMAIPAVWAAHLLVAPQPTAHPKETWGRWGYVAALAICLVAAITRAWIGSAVKPAPPADPEALRVMTYNLQQGYTSVGLRGYADQLEVIRAAHPDVLGLQESDTARFSGGSADLVRSLSEGLGLYSYYGPRTVTGTFGIALLSRYPIHNPRTFYMYSQGEQTAAILAEISANGRTYHVLVTHLGNDGPLIQQQQVLQRLDGLPDVIAMGDFNFDPKSPQYALTTQSLQDAWTQAGSPAAAGLDLNDLIDHVFVSPGTAVASANYIVSPASDHPALLVSVGK